MAADLSAWPEADDILDSALALPAEERTAFLQRAAGHDAGLLAALQAVVAEASLDDGFLAPGGALSGVLGGEIGRASAKRDSASPVRTTGAVANLRVGGRLEHYEIIGVLGRGGMGEVYRARDTRLGRDVAIKVLPDAVARDPERLARFRREARVLASLSHPGIGAIFGLAGADGVEALVLELVEGPTLAERIDGRPLPLAEALAIGRRLGAALEAAHARGILHRDLKPANVKLAPDGTVKILDFGLAKARGPSKDPDPDADPERESSDITAITGNLVFGTPAYMSPERVSRGEADERSDIWAFGCILYEMLTGVRAFPGESVAEAFARILEREPDYGRLPADTPEAVRRLLRRTLEKDPARRLTRLHDGLIDLADEIDRPAALGVPARSTGRTLVLLGVAAAVLAAGAWGVMMATRAGPPPAVTKLAIPLPPGDTPVTGFQPMMAVSSDSRVIVYRARRGSQVQLFRRSLQDLEPRAIAGTESGTSPFFSPDGTWLGFDADGVLKRVPIDGGPASTICDAPGGATATWLYDDTIVFATNTSRVLQRVPASGGTPAPLTTLDAGRGETLHLLPQALPDRRHVVFTITAGASRHVAVIDVDGKQRRILTEGTHGRYLPSGHLVFSRDGTLWSVPFAINRLAMTGAPQPVVEGIEHTDGTVAHFDAGADGSLVYLPRRGEDGAMQRLVWIDRAGSEAPVDLDPGPFSRLSLSPDGTRIAFAVRKRDDTDIWVFDSARTTFSRLTAEPTIETMPTWSPDGQSIAFRSEREGPGLFRRDPQGAGAIERLTETDGPIHSPYSWTRDGKTLLIAIFRSFRSQAIGAVNPPDRTVHVLLDGDFAQLDPQVSPDGRWLAYQSDESGRFEVYVRPYPDVKAGRWPISTTGGTSPRWSHDGRELFYLDSAGLMAVRVEAGSAFSARGAQRLFPVKPFGGRLGGDYEVAPDSRRFLFLVDGPAAAPQPAHLVVVQHWAEDLRARLAR